MSRTRCSTRCSACCAGRRCSRRCRAHSSIRSSAVPPTWARPIFRRAAQFQACLALLDTPEYRDEIGRRYRDKQGLQSPFVSWDALSEPLLALALDCVPAAHLKRVFERLLSDVKTNRSGLPDLIRFWPDESAMSWSR